MFKELYYISVFISEKKWLKYDGHCYYYAQEKHDWFTAEVGNQFILQ